jgi:arabinosyltransferase
MARYPDADILTSSDQVVPTVTDDSLDVWQEGNGWVHHWIIYHNFSLYFYNFFEALCLMCATVTGAYNIGIFHWRPTEAAKQLAKEWKELLVSDDTIWDQNGFNDLVHKVLGPSVQDVSTSDGGLVYAYDGTLKLGILPASIFCSGHTYFVQVLLVTSCYACLLLIQPCWLTCPNNVDCGLTGQVKPDCSVPNVNFVFFLNCEHKKD